MTGLAESSALVPTAARVSTPVGKVRTLAASYGSVFSSRATVVVLMASLYLSAVIFLGGIQIDALVREQRRKAST